MAEILTADVGTEEGAPASPSPSAGADQPTAQYVTREDHESAIRWSVQQTVAAVGELLAKNYQGTQQMLDRKITEIARQAGLSSAETAAILDEVGTETLGADRIQEAKARARVQAEAAAKVADDIAEREALKAELAAEKAGKANPELLARRQEQANSLWRGMKLRVEKLAAGQGVTAQPILDRATKDRWARVQDAPDLEGAMVDFEEYVASLITSAADARHAAEQPRAEIDASGGGGAAGTAKDKYLKALREGNALPYTPSEIDRMTAGFV